jgi:6-phospho-beta-glucosidase
LFQFLETCFLGKNQVSRYLETMRQDPLPLPKSNSRVIKSNVDAREQLSKRKGTTIMSIKVAVLGGSGVATPLLVQAIHQTPGRTQAIDLVLNGRSAEKLEIVTGIAALLAEGDPLLEVSAVTDIRSALSGADYVLNQVRVGGMQARSFDESFPNPLGIPGEETLGPGGFANAARTIPVTLEYAQLMEQVCPEAMLLSFANPASLVQYAVTRYTRLRTIGLCDAPLALIHSIAAALQLPASELVVDYLGMHHFGWVSAVWHNGVDLMPAVLAKAGAINPTVDSNLIQALGVLPGSYLNYIFHPAHLLAQKLGKPTRADELVDLQDEIMSEYRSCLVSREKPQSLGKRKASWYANIIAPVLLAMIEGRVGAAAFPGNNFILNLSNQGAIPWLPEDAVVEVPARIEAGRIRRFVTGDLPADIRCLLQRNCAYEQMTVEAIVEHDRPKALRALLLNPMIHTYEQAAAVLEKVWA